MGNNINEEWADIAGYEGYYQVSNLGRIKSLGRFDKYRPYDISDKILKPVLQKRTGYYTVCLHNAESIKIKSIHRLVALAFIPNPENKPAVNHKKGIKTDNRASELEWATHSENIQHAYDNGLKDKPTHMMGRIAEMANYKKAVAQLNKDGSFIKFWVSAADVQRHLGYAKSNINMVCRGERELANGFRWKFKTELPLV